ncbi:MAG: glycogen/starch/alpha-glucan phosphorylase [Candidatus Borkfalkiaceae bacterium]|nr:glycogen/starch/alpha-glucan phosphorylase [Christensenellaceae bacterium]
MYKTENFSVDVAKDAIEGKLSRFFGVTPAECSEEQLYKAVVMVVRDILLEKRNAYHTVVKEQKAKKVYYLCMEFLLGRSLKNNVFNLGIGSSLEGALKEFGTSLDNLYELEPDAGLGNGGLGRLAACFMDALASGDYPAMGYSIRYEYGLFKQKIVDGWQTELPDIWLPGGEVWLTQRADKMFTVKFDGHIKEEWTENGLKVDYFDYQEIEALPYDMMISGYNSEAVSVLRLWSAQNRKKFDMRSFSQGDYMQSMQADNEAELISKVLYPSDNHFEGKSLRLKQQYFLVSASLQNIIADHVRRYGSLDNLPDMAAIHINDTHPALVVPELMRILIDEYGYDWDKAWSIVVRTVAYTNHTVMSEALEKWNEDLIERRLPRVYSIIKEINRRFCADMWNKFPGDWDKIERMSIISHGQIRMANLSVIGSHKVNGVSALHSDIIKNSIFKDFNDVTPDKFTNVTNGIAYRRWLCQSNPELTSLIADLIGDGFKTNAEELKKFEAFKGDADVQKRVNEIKLIKKKQFAEYVLKRTGEKINPETLFDVQAKRLHEYKRQLMNAMNIIASYIELKENPKAAVQPKTYIFAAKAAPGYYMAKEIIKLICFIAEDVKKHPEIREKLNVIYLEDYGVTMAEKLMPASEISEQISTAGKEASGTGNMKFMINGALTVGTLDGANVEMHDAVGDDNIFIFGLTAKDVDGLWARGYNATAYYNNNVQLQKVIDALKAGFNGTSFENLANYLLTASPVADPYMCMADFGAYREIQAKVSDVYQNKSKWAEMSIVNIANSGRFSADRAIKEYAENIWNLKSTR